MISNTHGMIEGTSLKNSGLKGNQMIATVDLSGGKKISSTAKYNPNATNNNLYSMIY